MTMHKHVSIHHVITTYVARCSVDTSQLAPTNHNPEVYIATQHNDRPHPHIHPAGAQQIADLEALHRVHDDRNRRRIPQRSLPNCMPSPIIHPPHTNKHPRNEIEHPHNIPTILPPNHPPLVPLPNQHKTNNHHQHHQHHPTQTE